MGFVIARLLPPFILDDQFWREFWTGPPAAGIFAVLTASIAYGASVHSSAVAKETAADESGRKQVEMAINMAVDDSSTKRMVGLNLLDVLFGKHGDGLDDIIFSVAVQVSGMTVDGTGEDGDTRGEAGDEHEV